MANYKGPRVSRAERFMLKVEKREDGCWIWTGTKHPWGYGQFQMGDKSAAGNFVPERAHRAAYRLFRGPIPDGLYVDHLCRNQICVNPDHLEPVTNAENIAREYRRRNRIRCRRGHPWTAANTALWGVAGRSCRRCHADYQTARYHRLNPMAKYQPRQLAPGNVEEDDNE